LGDGESVIATFPGAVLRLKGADANLLADGAGGYPGRSGRKVVRFSPRLKEGSLFVTNRRILFLRRSHGWKEGYTAFREAIRLDTSLRGGASIRVKYAEPWMESFATNLPLMGMLHCAGLEYCEIPLEEIVSLQRTFTGGRIRIESDGRAYSLSLTKGQAESVAKLLGART